MARLVALLLALLSGVAACGGDRPAVSAPSDAGQEIAHIHGLGVDPVDDSLVIATHTGLFSAPAGTTESRRVSDSRQDTMGFTVVGADEYLGSGHPDARENLPPLLGLIRSEDGGQKWDPISLLGEVDFHVLRAQGKRIYGVDSQSGHLFVSADGGDTWRRRKPPGALLDIAIDPDDPVRVVASGERGLLLSRDAGNSWRPLSDRVVGLLAWTDALTVVDGTGGVFTAQPGAGGFERIAQVDGQPAAFASHGQELLLALHDNTVVSSPDGGRSWETRLTAGVP